MGHKETFNAPAGHTGSSPQLVAVIRDAIVRAIIDGQYPRGARLPTNPEIQQRWRVSARTSRKVLAQLTEEGWAISEGTRGYTSTGGPPGTPAPGPARAHAPGREADDHTDTYDPRTDTRTPLEDTTLPDDPAHPQAPAPHPGNQPPSALPPAPPVPRPVHTVAIGAAIPEQLSAVHLISATYEPAPPEVAYALRMDGPGLPVMVRRRLITDPAGNIPLELRTSYTPAVPADSPLARPAVLPGTWTDNLAAHTGHRPATGTSHIRIRPASPYEAPALHLTPGAYILMRATTTHTDDGTPIDHTVSVWPETTTINADRHPLT
ncbi:GntR family transcriptional regulator [Actinomadura geliboluensis]|uniref:UTRA domain-containing protein n=1 Tax=Actinomadura geliboluensis TaxID=882440 RepID=UPI0026035122|nr:GntR family transcriptional regulator [Actinomadura geliboluensis]